MATWEAARACIVREKTPRNSSYLATWLYLGGWPACTPPTWWTRTRLWRRTTTTKKTHQNRVIHLDIEVEKKLRYKKLICKNFVKSMYVIHLQIWIDLTKYFCLKVFLFSHCSALIWRNILRLCSFFPIFFQLCSTFEFEFARPWNFGNARLWSTTAPSLFWRYPARVRKISWLCKKAILFQMKFSEVWIVQIILHLKPSVWNK